MMISAGAQCEDTNSQSHDLISSLPRDEYVKLLSENLGMLHFSCRQQNALSQPKVSCNGLNMANIKEKVGNMFGLLTPGLPGDIQADKHDFTKTANQKHLPPSFKLEFPGDFVKNNSTCPESRAPTCFLIGPKHEWYYEPPQQLPSKTLLDLSREANKDGSLSEAVERRVLSDGAVAGNKRLELSKQEKRHKSYDNVSKMVEKGQNIHGFKEGSGTPKLAIAMTLANDTDIEYLKPLIAIGQNSKSKSLKKTKSLTDFEGSAKKSSATTGKRPKPLKQRSLDAMGRKKSKHKDNHTPGSLTQTLATQAMVPFLPTSTSSSSHTSLQEKKNPSSLNPESSVDIIDATGCRPNTITFRRPGSPDFTISNRSSSPSEQSQTTNPLTDSLPSTRSASLVTADETFDSHRSSTNNMDELVVENVTSELLKSVLTTCKFDTEDYIYDPVQTVISPVSSFEDPVEPEDIFQPSPTKMMIESPDFTTDESNVESSISPVNVPKVFSPRHEEQFEILPKRKVTDGDQNQQVMLADLSFNTSDSPSVPDPSSLTFDLSPSILDEPSSSVKSLTNKVLDLSGHTAERISIVVEPSNKQDLTSGEQLLRVAARALLVGSHHKGSDHKMTEEMQVGGERVKVAAAGNEKEVQVSFLLRVVKEGDGDSPACVVEDVDLTSDQVNNQFQVGREVKQKNSAKITDVKRVQYRCHRSSANLHPSPSSASNRTKPHKISLKLNTRCWSALNRLSLVPVLHSTCSRRLIRHDRYSHVHLFSRCITEHSSNTLRRFLVKSLNSEERAAQSTTSLATSETSVEKLVRLVTQTAWIGPVMCQVGGVVFKPVPLATYPRLYRLVSRVSGMLSRRCRLVAPYNSILVHQCLNGSESYSWHRPLDHKRDHTRMQCKLHDPTFHTTPVLNSEPGMPACILTVGASRRLLMLDKRERVRGVVLASCGSLVFLRHGFLKRLRVVVERDPGVRDSTLFLTFYRCVVSKAGDSG